MSHPAINKDLIINLINEWDSAANAAKHRDDLRRMAREFNFRRKDSTGYEIADIGRFLVYAFAKNDVVRAAVAESQNDKPTMGPSGDDAKRVRGVVTVKYPPNDDMHQFDWANLVIDHGFHNKEILERYGIREAEKAMNYIAMAATNPDVADELPEDGVRFWRAVIHTFKAFMANKALGRE
jgi:hypothetical protein